MTEIMKVMDAAKGIMRQSGNMRQWGEGYPSEAVISGDMEIIVLLIFISPNMSKLIQVRPARYSLTVLSAPGIYLSTSILISQSVPPLKME